jgi:hypothetical protein
LDGVGEPGATGGCVVLPAMTLTLSNTDVFSWVVLMLVTASPI